MANSTTRKPATPEEIWEILRETSELQKESDARWKRLEIEAEKNRQEAEKDRQEMKKRVKDLDIFFRGHWGVFMESLVRGDLVKLLKDRGIQVTRTSPNIIIEDANGYKIAEFDIVAANGREVVVVEVKTTMNSKDVERFSEKMDRIREWLTEYADKPIYGAMAYLKCGDGADTFAQRKGFFVIRATGSSASIINKENFKAQGY